jgi:tRNA dimethylallyltransferase
MTEQNNRLPLVAIVGPTASGKSTLGVWLAEKLGGEVVACDSTQLYRGFDIGTAKPSQTERRGIPHHLTDVLDANQEATAGGYRQLALEVLEELRRRQCLPIFTVGTGLYLRALVDGLAEAPQRSEEIRERLRADATENRPGYLHRVLQEIDPEAAQKIAAADEQKLIRAIEVCMLAQKPLSDVHRTPRMALEGWRAIKVGLMPDRELLKERIHARTESMLAQGWEKEAKDLLASGLLENAKPFDFIGYREMRAVLRDELKLEAAREAIQIATRQYAKRQLTWFRKDASVRWFNGFGDEAGIQVQVLDWLSEKVQIDSGTD